MQAHRSETHARVTTASRPEAELAVYGQVSGFPVPCIPPIQLS
jgi:hypothetical protein